METCSQEWVLGVGIVKSNEKNIDFYGIWSGRSRDCLSPGFTQGVGNLLTPVMGEGHIPRVRKRADMEGHSG